MSGAERCPAANHPEKRHYLFCRELALPRPFRFIAPSQFVDGGTVHGIKAPIGTGPWMLKTTKLNPFDVLARNPRYWGEKPAIDQVTVKVIPDPMIRAVAFETGDIDLLYGNEGLLPLDTFAVSATTRPGAPSFSARRNRDAGAGLAKAPTNELAVREALNWRSQQKSLIDNALYGTQQVADTLFAPSVPYANIGLTPRRYDPQKANALP